MFSVDQSSAAYHCLALSVMQLYLKAFITCSHTSQCHVTEGGLRPAKLKKFLLSLWEGGWRNLLAQTIFHLSSVFYKELDRQVLHWLQTLPHNGHSPFHENDYDGSSIGTCNFRFVFSMYQLCLDQPAWSRGNQRTWESCMTWFSQIVQRDSSAVSFDRVELHSFFVYLQTEAESRLRIYLISVFFWCLLGQRTLY